MTKLAAWAATNLMKVAFSLPNSVNKFKRFRSGRLVYLVVGAFVFGQEQHSALTKFSPGLFITFELDPMPLVSFTTVEERLHTLRVADIPVELERRVLLPSFRLPMVETLVFHLFSV